MNSDERFTLKLKTFINIGKSLTVLSTCKRVKVSAIVFPTDFSAIYAIGYNGPPRGLPNDACTGEAGECGCPHAEANALIKFNANVAKPSLMYSTQHPCHYCAELILNCTPLVAVIYNKIMYTNRVKLGRKLFHAAEFPTFSENEINRSSPEDVAKVLRGLG